MDKAVRYFPGILMIFHLIGIGLFAYLSSAPSLTYLTILMSAILVLLSENDKRKSALVFGVIFFAGYAIELIGVQTGLLFGNYKYGVAMGPVLFGTPLIIGATWYAVVVGACAVVFRLSINRFFKSVLAGVLTVIMDFAIEQVAMKYNLWQWEHNAIPVFNYICWFIFGSIFAFFYFRNISTINITGRYLFWIWAAFFFILTFI